MFDDVEGIRGKPLEYRKTATVLAGKALGDGVIHTLEGDLNFHKGDYICGPGAAGEYWPVRQDIFETTYAPVPARPKDGYDHDVPTPSWPDGTPGAVGE